MSDLRSIVLIAPAAILIVLALFFEVRSQTDRGGAGRNSRLADLFRTAFLVVALAALVFDVITRH